MTTERAAPAINPYSDYAASPFAPIQMPVWQPNRALAQSKVQAPGIILQIYGGVLILAGLACAIGLPFLLLSATGPLLQRWFTYTHAQASPYRLYALSNLGSLLGLVSYPFVFKSSD